MKYIIDTDILSYFLKKHPQVVSKFEAADPDDIATTIINYTELLFGAYKSTKVEQKLTAIKAFLETLTTVGFDKRAGEKFAQLKAKLQKQGTLLADMDLMIASICLANGFTLVTNNTKHFKRIENLTIENWSQDVKVVELGQSQAAAGAGNDRNDI